jgi:hypothetical protein
VFVCFVMTHVSVLVLIANLASRRVGRSFTCALVGVLMSAASTSSIFYSTVSNAFA